MVERSISDIGYIQSRKGPVKTAIVAAYVEGLSYTYSKQDPLHPVIEFDC